VAAFPGPPLPRCISSATSPVLLRSLALEVTKEAGVLGKGLWSLHAYTRGERLITLLDLLNTLCRLIPQKFMGAQPQTLIKMCALLHSIPQRIAPSIHLAPTSLDFKLLSRNATAPARGTASLLGRFRFPTYLLVLTGRSFVCCNLYLLKIPESSARGM
jgi:hypothetical protein